MINVIADRYAQALFEVGEETQTTSELYQELSELVDILNENKDLYNFLKSPLIGIEAVSYTHLTLPTTPYV